MNKRAAFHNLGCKVNSYELDIMRQILTERGYSEVPFDADADVYVVNTCSVTNIADRKSRQMLHRARKKNPSAVVIAVGCYVETDRARVEQDPAVDLAIGNREKRQIARILEAYLERRGSADDSASGDMADGDMTAAAAASAASAAAGQAGSDGSDPDCGRGFLRSPGHTRAFLKIQDGCNQFCTYCIIPYARGRIRSRDPEEIVEEVRRLTEPSAEAQEAPEGFRGVREVVLNGIHLSSFGQTGNVPFDPELGGRSLLALLRQLQEIPGLQRIRLGSLEPRIMTEEFVQGIAGLSKVCPHFHLSLQSGCDATLKRMNRHYTTADYRECLERLRRVYDRPAITTDVIVGFPGETDEEFAQTVAFLEEIGLYEIHVFKYSVRKGTVAAGLPGQVPEQVKNARSDVLLKLTEEQARRYRDSWAGQQVRIIPEERVPRGGKLWWRGYTERYVECLIPADSPGAVQGELFTLTMPAQER